MTHHYTNNTWVPGEQEREGPVPLPTKNLHDGLYFNDVTGKTGNVEADVRISLLDLTMKQDSLSTLGLKDEWHIVSTQIEKDFANEGIVELAIAGGIVTNKGLDVKTNITRFGGVPGMAERFNAFLNKFVAATGQLEFVRSTFVSDATFNESHTILFEAVYTIGRTTPDLLWHKDSDGQIVFVNLICNNDQKIPATEWTLDVDPMTGEKLAVFKNSWPESFIEKVTVGRSALKMQYGDAPEIHGDFFPPYGYASWVDELVWHSTPFLGNRKTVDMPEVLNALMDAYNKSPKTPLSNLMLGVLAYVATTPGTQLSNFAHAKGYGAEGWSAADIGKLQNDIFINKHLSFDQLAADIKTIDWSSIKASGYMNFGQDVHTPDPLAIYKTSSEEKYLYKKINAARRKRANSNPDLLAQLRQQTQAAPSRNFMRLYIKVVKND